jgi:hypothetical protein
MTCRVGGSTLLHLTSFTYPSSLSMPPQSRIESLPTELLSGILTRCSREDLVNLAQTHNNLHTACRKELVNYLFTMRITSASLKSWAVYFRKESTLLTEGVRSLDIAINVTKQDLLDAFDDVDPTVFDVNAQPTHPDAGRILPLPSSLRKLSLVSDSMRGHNFSSDFLLLLLFRPLPERCPHLEELIIQASPRYASDEFHKCIFRRTRLRKLHLRVWHLFSIPNRLSLIPASLADLNLCATDIQTQERVATAVTWIRGIRKIDFARCAPQDIANILRILSRGGATHLTELILEEDRDGADPAAMMSLREALTLGLQEFSLLQPPLHTLSLTGPSGWSDFLHLSPLHTAVVSTLMNLYLQDMDSCVFPSHLPWPRLQSLEIISIPKVGYQGPLSEPIFPTLTAITMYEVDEIQTPEDLFPALEAIKWYSTTTPEQVASLVRHDIRRIDMTFDDMEVLYEPLWEAMGGHTIGLIALKGHFPEWMDERSNNGERIFPGFPNIREFTLKWRCSIYYL